MPLEMNDNPKARIDKAENQVVDTDTYTSLDSFARRCIAEFEGAASESEEYVYRGPLPEHMYDCYKHITDHQCRLIKQSIQRRNLPTRNACTAMATILKYLMGCETKCNGHQKI